MAGSSSSDPGKGVIQSDGMGDRDPAAQKSQPPVPTANPAPNVGNLTGSGVYDPEVYSTNR